MAAMEATATVDMATEATATVGAMEVTATVDMATAVTSESLATAVTLAMVLRREPKLLARTK